MFADLENDLPFDLGAVQTAKKAVVIYTEKCSKCAGTGIYTAPSSYGHVCFKCGGAGKFEFKTSPEYRAAQREKSAVNKVAKAAAKAEAITKKRQAFYAAFAKECDWVYTRAATFGFAQSLREDLEKYGNLTDRQLGAVVKCIAADKTRKDVLAQRAAAAPAADVSRLHQIFGVALSRGLKSPKLRLAAFTFSPAKSHSQNAGAIYVVESATDQYLGKVMDGKLIGSKSMSEASQEAILKVACNPEESAVAYGRMTGRCSVCNRELSNKESVERGIGPICAQSFGW